MLQPIQLKLLNSIRVFMKSDKQNKINIESVEEYGAILRMAKEHHIEPMVYDSINRINDSNESYQKIQSFMKRRATYLIMNQSERTRNFVDIYDKLTNIGVESLIIKGLICRNLYDKPDFRPSSDEDMLIRQDDFTKCDDFLLKNGFVRDDIDVEHPPYEVSYINNKIEIAIDVHLALFSDENLTFKNMNDEFEGVWQKKKSLNFNGSTLYTLDDTLHFFYLLCHSYKHFVSIGVGIRQLCDILTMAEKCGKNIEWQFIEEKTKKYNMYVFFMSIFSIGEKYLGFDLKKSYCPLSCDNIPDCDDMLLDILAGGVYGASSMGRIHSANITLNSISGDKARVSLRSSLFPSVRYMKREYPYLKKYIWLMPVAWMQRVLKYLKRRRVAKKSGEKEVDSISVGKQRVELLKKYGIIE